MMLHILIPFCVNSRSHIFCASTHLPLTSQHTLATLSYNHITTLHTLLPFILPKPSSQSSPLSSPQFSPSPTTHFHPFPPSEATPAPPGRSNTTPPTPTSSPLAASATRYASGTSPATCAPTCSDSNIRLFPWHSTRRGSSSQWRLGRSCIRGTGGRTCRGCMGGIRSVSRQCQCVDRWVGQWWVSGGSVVGQLCGEGGPVVRYEWHAVGGVLRAV